MQLPGYVMLVWSPVSQNWSDSIWSQVHDQSWDLFVADLNHPKIHMVFNVATEVRVLFLALYFWDQMLFAKG